MASIRNKIGEGVFYGSIGNLVIKIFAAVGYFLILKELSLHDYGIFVILTSVIGPVAAIVFLSFDRIFVSKYAQALARNDWAFMKGIFREYYILNFILLATVVVAGFFLRDLLTRFYDVYIVQFFWGTVALVVSQFLMNQVSLFLESNEKFREISILQTGESIVRVVLVIAVTAFAGISINSVLYIYTASKFVSVLIGLVSFLPLAFRLNRNPAVPEVGVIKKLIMTVGKWEIARNIFEQFIQPIKYGLIKIFVNIEAVAVFDFARNIYSFTGSMFPVSKIIFPIISRSITDKEKIYLIISKAKKYMFLAYVPMYIAVLVATTPVLNLLFPQYSGFEAIIFLTVLHFLTEVYKMGQSALLYAYNRQKFIFFVTPLFVVSQILLDIFFVSSFGLVGIVLSWHAHAFLSGAVYDYYIHRSIGIRRSSWREIFRYDDYDKLVLSGLMHRVRKFLPL